MKIGEDYIGISVVYFCHDGNGNFLMQKRGANCRDENGRWDIGAGAVEFGMSVEDTLKTEIMQEYSTWPINSEFLGYRNIQRTNDETTKTHWVTLDFKALVDPERVANGEPHKFDEIGWFNLKEIPSPVHSQLPDFLRRYKERLLSKL